DSRLAEPAQACGVPVDHSPGRGRQDADPARAGRALAPAGDVAARGKDVQQVLVLRLEVAVRAGLATLHELAVAVDVLEPVRPRLPVVGDRGEVVVAADALGCVLVPRAA